MKALLGVFKKNRQRGRSAMKGIIFQIPVTYHLENNPSILNINDVYQDKGKPLLILEIESLHLKENKLTIMYIMQTMDPVSSRDPIEYANYQHAAFKPEIFRSLYDKEDYSINAVNSGRVIIHLDRPYKVLELLEISYIAPDIKVIYSVKPVYLIHPDKVRKKRMEAQKEQMRLQVISKPEVQN